MMVNTISSTPRKGCWARLFLLLVMLPGSLRAQPSDLTFVEVAFIMVEDRALADSPYTLIQNGASFFELAARYSKVPNAKEGYQSRWFPATQVPELASLAAGETTPVLQLNDEAYWLFRKVFSVDALTYRVVEEADSLNRSVMSLHGAGRYAEAIEVAERVLALLRRVLGEDHPDVALSLENYAGLLRKTGRSVEAERLEARAKAIRAKHAAQNPAK